MRERMNLLGQRRFIPTKTVWRAGLGTHVLIYCSSYYEPILFSKYTKRYVACKERGTSPNIVPAMVNGRAFRTSTTGSPHQLTGFKSRESSPVPDACKREGEGYIYIDINGIVYACSLLKLSLDNKCTSKNRVTVLH